MNTHTIITNIDQKVSKLCEEADGKNQVVSDTYVLYHYRINANHRTGSKEVSDLDH